MRNVNDNHVNINKYIIWPANSQVYHYINEDVPLLFIFNIGFLKAAALKFQGLTNNSNRFPNIFNPKPSQDIEASFFFTINPQQHQESHVNIAQTAIDRTISRVTDKTIGFIENVDYTKYNVTGFVNENTLNNEVENENIYFLDNVWYTKVIFDPIDSTPTLLLYEIKYLFELWKKMNMHKTNHVFVDPLGYSEQYFTDIIVVNNIINRFFDFQHHNFYKQLETNICNMGLLRKAVLYEKLRLIDISTKEILFREVISAHEKELLKLQKQLYKVINNLNTIELLEKKILKEENNINNLIEERKKEKDSFTLNCTFDIIEADIHNKQQDFFKFKHNNYDLERNRYAYAAYYVALTFEDDDFTEDYRLDLQNLFEKNGLYLKFKSQLPEEHTYVYNILEYIDYNNPCKNLKIQKDSFNILKDTYEKLCDKNGIVLSLDRKLTEFEQRVALINLIDLNKEFFPANFLLQQMDVKSICAYIQKHVHV